jgi:hypothetical protein
MAEYVSLEDYAKAVAACMKAIERESGVTASFPDDIGLLP